MITLSVILLVLALFVVWFIRVYLPRIAEEDKHTDVPATVIHSGKDPSWHAPVFHAGVHAPFFIKPWLQAGDAPRFASAAEGESLEIVWHTVDDSQAFRVEIGAAGSAKNGAPAPDPNRPVFIPASRPIAMSGVVAQVQYVAKITGLKPGEKFDYTVFADGLPVYTATAKARPPAGSAFKAMIFGDMGNGHKWQKMIAHQMSKNDKHGAEIVFSTGDVVYQNGRYSEYLSKFFAVYQPQQEGPDFGATLFDDTVALTCGGNHDFGWLGVDELVTFDVYPDMFAYYPIWSMPLNGPDSATLGANQPPLKGHSASIKAMLDASGERFPRMANYSYDYGTAHFLVLDANVYMDWTDAKLRQWVEDDLKAVAKGQWKIVIFHQPPFTSNQNHQDEQRMRFLTDIFERCGVDVVFSGHAHMYDRSYPLKFTVAGGIKRSAMEADGKVPGKFVYDTKFDGVKNTVPSGIVYIVTGGGGAKLDSKELDSQPSLWQPSTVKLLGERHSFTVLDFTPQSLRLTQIDYEGNKFDEFVITKNPAGN